MAYIRLIDQFYPLSERDIRNAFPNTSFATPFNPEGYAVVFPVPQPTFDWITQAVREIAPVLTIKGTWGQAWEIYSLTPEQIAKNQALAEEEALKIEKARVDKLWQSAYDYEFAQISGTAVALLTAGFVAGKPKALAIAAWSNELWNGPNGYYARRDSGSTDYDFSNIGLIPYSIPELSAEVSNG